MLNGSRLREQGCWGCREFWRSMCVYKYEEGRESDLGSNEPNEQQLLTA